MCTYQFFLEVSTSFFSGDQGREGKVLNLMYVTEESDDPENPNGIVEHKLPWRSQSKLSNITPVSCYFLLSELDEFMSVLERRLSNKQPQAAGLVAKKVCRIGIPSDSVQPSDAPAWSVNKMVH